MDPQIRFAVTNDSAPIATCHRRRGAPMQLLLSAGVVFEDRGEPDMKGVGEPVWMYVVRTEGV